MNITPLVLSLAMAAQGATSVDRLSSWPADVDEMRPRVEVQTRDGRKVTVRVDRIDETQLVVDEGWRFRAIPRAEVCRLALKGGIRPGWIVGLGIVGAVAGMAVAYPYAFASDTRNNAFSTGFLVGASAGVGVGAAVARHEAGPDRIIYESADSSCPSRD